MTIKIKSNFYIVCTYWSPPPTFGNGEDSILTTLCSCPVYSEGLTTFYQ